MSRLAQDSAASSAFLDQGSRLPRICGSHKLFAINTYKSVSKHKTSTTFRMNSCTKTCRGPLELPIQPVHRNPAEQLGEKIRRFLRHHFTRRRNLHHLLHL